MDVPVVTAAVKGLTAHRERQSRDSSSVGTDRGDRGPTREIPELHDTVGRPRRERQEGAPGHRRTRDGIPVPVTEISHEGFGEHARNLGGCHRPRVLSGALHGVVLGVEVARMHAQIARALSFHRSSLPFESFDLHVAFRCVCVCCTLLRTVVACSLLFVRRYRCRLQWMFSLR